MKITAEQREAWRTNTADSPFNQWLKAKVAGVGGNLDLDRLHELATEYGIDRRTRLAHLNPGQQRMIVGNMLRTRVPRDHYEAELGDQEQAVLEINASEGHDFILTAGVRELLVLHAEIIAELRSREIVRTSNSPVGDYAELLFSIAFEWKLKSNSSAGYDATSQDGTRYQIKSRRVTTANPSRQLSAIRRLDERTFDVLACVIFDAEYRISKAVLVPHEIVVAKAKRVEHTNSWRFIADDRVWLLDGVTDVTAAIVSAAEGY